MTRATIEKTSFRGWPNCYRVSNDTVDLIVTGDVGPRIMRFGFLGGQNFFKEFDDQLGRSGEPTWQPRGGHRLWFAPEDPVLTYAPDNSPVRIEIADGVLDAVAPVEELTGLEKRIVITMAETGSHVEVVHHIRNAGKKPLDLAPWALTMMAQGGTGIHGFPPRGTHPEQLAPTNPLVMWAFTDLTDSRWKLLQRYLVLQQDPLNSIPQKLGSFNPDTWGAYLLHEEVFIKRTRVKGKPSQYPDCGCSYETFTNGDFLELETLGPLTRLQPGETVTHTESWNAYRDVHVLSWTDAELDRVIAPLTRGAS